MREIRKCLQCGDGFIWYTSHKNKSGGKFCSFMCASIHKTLPRIKRICESCNKEFFIRASDITTQKRSKFLTCSRKCFSVRYSRIMKGVRNLKISGEKSHFWKGGITPVHKMDRLSSEHNIWRVAVFKRDGFKCQVCGIKKTPLNAHHKKAFCDFPELRLDINNGITLCIKCHKEEHEKNGDIFHHIIGLGNGRLREQRDKLEGEAVNTGN